MSQLHISQVGDMIFYIITDVVFASTPIENLSTLGINIADYYRRRKCDGVYIQYYNFSGQVPYFIKSKLFQTYFSSNLPIRCDDHDTNVKFFRQIQSLASSKRKQTKVRSHRHIVTCTTLLNINYDRIAKFNLVILPFKFINSVKIFIISFILYSWNEIFQ